MIGSTIVIDGVDFIVGTGSENTRPSVDCQECVHVARRRVIAKQRAKRVRKRKRAAEKKAAWRAAHPVVRHRVRREWLTHDGTAVERELASIADRVGARRERRDGVRNLIGYMAEPQSMHDLVAHSGMSLRRCQRAVREMLGLGWIRRHDTYRWSGHVRVPLYCWAADRAGCR